MRSVLAKVPSALALVALVCTAALAQGGEVAQPKVGDLTGRVLDEDGAAANATVTVTVTNEVAKQPRTTQTDSDGKFTIPQLPVGKYTVTVATSRYDQKVDVGEGKTDPIKVQLVTPKSILIPYFVTMFCGALILILLDAWLRFRGVKDRSLIWLYLTLLSWAAAKIPVLIGWSVPPIVLPQLFGRQSQLKAIPPDQVKYLFSIVSSLCFTWAAFQLSRVRDLFETDEQFKSYRRIIVWWVVLPISLVSLALQFFPGYEKAANVTDAIASLVACLVFLIGLTYSFHRYNNRFFIVYTWATIPPFVYRQFYIALNHTPRAGMAVPLSLLNTTMLVMLFIALAVAWALSDTARLKTVKISPKVYIVAMFFDLRGSTQWAEVEMDRDFDCIKDFIEELREWVLSETLSLPQGCPTFVKFLGDGFMYIWEIQRGAMTKNANTVIELACDLSAKYPSWVKEIKSVSPWKPPDGIGFGVDVSNAIRMTFENGSDDYLGSPVSLASKMQNMARPRGVVIKEKTWDILDEKLRDRFPNAGVMRIGDQEIHIRAIKEVKLPEA
jgi:class 3 adenylate cyclase